MDTSSHSTESQRDRLLNGKVFTTLSEAKVLIEDRRKEYNQGYGLPPKIIPSIELELNLREPIE